MTATDPLLELVGLLVADAGGASTPCGVFPSRLNQVGWWC